MIEPCLVDSEEIPEYCRQYMRQDIASLHDLVIAHRAAAAPHMANLLRRQYGIDTHVYPGSLLETGDSDHSEFIWDAAARACDWLHAHGYYTAPIRPHKVTTPRAAMQCYNLVERWLLNAIDDPSGW